MGTLDKKGGGVKRDKGGVMEGRRAVTVTGDDCRPVFSSVLF